MKIKILASGCSGCISFFELFQRTAKEYNPELEVELVDDIIKIMEYRILSLPGIVINEELVSSGKHLSKEEILDLLTSNKNFS
ncbi:MAG: thioredoxin family protein [Rikenellaceae bacterium]